MEITYRMPSFISNHSTLRLILLIGIFQLAVTGVFTQTKEDLDWSETLLRQSKPANNKERVEILDQISERLSLHAKDDPEARQILEILRVQRALYNFDEQLLDESINEAIHSADPQVRAREAAKARNGLIERTAFLVSTIDPKDLSPAEVERFTGVLKTTMKWWDEINDPSLLGSKASLASVLLGFGNGLAKLAAATDDPGAKRIWDGLNSTLGAFKVYLPRHGISVPNTLSVISMPAEIMAGVSDHSRKGYHHATNFMNGFEALVNQQPGAEAQMNESRAELAKILKPESYGRAMLGAISGNLLSKVPFLGTLKNWLLPDPLGWLIGTWKVVDMRGPKTYLMIEFRAEGGVVNGYVVALSDPYLEGLGLAQGQIVYRNIVLKIAPAPHPPFATGECVQRVLDFDRNTHFLAFGNTNVENVDNFGTTKLGRGCVEDLASGEPYVRTIKVN